jgi:hypothetical protein
MTHRQALNILLKLADRELKRLAFDANLAKTGAANEYLQRRLVERERLREAVERVKGKDEV